MHQVPKRFVQKSVLKQGDALASMLISQQTESFETFIDKYGPISDVNHGYLVQNEMAEILETQHGLKKHGWKIGCTAPNIQAMFGVNEPFVGPFYHTWTQSNPQKPKGITMGVEAEWIFKIGDTLDIRNISNVSLDDIYPLVECVYCGYELIELRIIKENIFSTPIQYLIADLAWTGGVMIGNASTLSDMGHNSWKEYDEHRLCKSKVTAYVGDKNVGVGVARQILESPFIAMQYLYNFLLERGETVQKGALISTGTATGLNVLNVNEIAKAVFDDLGEVQFKFV